MKFKKSQLITIFILFLTCLIVASARAEDESAISNFHTANKLLKEGKYEDALKKYDAVIQHASSSELRQGAIYWKGQIYFRQGKFEQAQEIFQSLIEVYPDSSIVPIAREMMQRAKQSIQPKPTSGPIFTRLRMPKDSSWRRREPGISPDGKDLVYVAATGYSWPLRLSVLPIKTFDSDVVEEPKVLLEEPEKLMAEYQQPTWSPDGKWIAFYRWENELHGKEYIPKNMGVYMIPAEGGEMQFLAPANCIIDKRGGVSPGGLSWSPDSKQLAFVSRENYKADIYIVSIETKKVRPFTNDRKDNEFPSWSSDGKKIAFSSRRGIWLGDATRTWIKPIDGSEAVLMGELGSAISPIIWSPDGKMIACRGIMPGFKKMGFVAIPVDEQGKTSGMPILLKEERLNVTKRLLHWTSDGKIIFLREDFQQALYVAEIAGGAPVSVADEAQFVFDRLNWTPDGKSFFLPNGKDQRPGFLDIESGKFFELRIDELDIFVSGAVLSPDGTTVAFSAIGRENLIPQDGSMLPKGGVQIYTAPASGGKSTQLTEGEFYNFDIHWSNDSKSIAFARAEIAGEKKFSSKICVMSVNGGEAKELTKAGFYLEPTWSPDDKMIAYVHLRSRKDEVLNPEEMEGDIYVLPATGGKPKQITDTSEREYNIHWSPDGKMIAFDTNGKAWVVPATGGLPAATIAAQAGKPRLVSETGTGGQGPSRWTPDGKYLICTRGRGFWKAPVESDGEPVELPIHVQSKSLYSPVLSPDGKKVAFKAGASEIQYWMMENFLSDE